MYCVWVLFDVVWGWCLSGGVIVEECYWVDE